MSQTSYLIPGSSTHYDYIIAGAGAAGLSLLTRMVTSGKFADKKILLLDKEPKIYNDRTWCFWEREAGFFEALVYKSWPSLWFHGDGFSKQFDIAPYQYKMIRGIDFYNFCFDLVSTQENVTIKYGNVHGMQSNKDETSLLLGDKKYTADYIFNSILFKKPGTTRKQLYLLQHFKGWIVETKEPIFNQQQATLMDFRISQQNGTAFVYVMPFSANRALVEFTMFSKELLAPEAYDRNLEIYISNQLHCDNYSILDMEFGTIPMTNYRFPSNHHHIINIGTAGGQTKASTGYTFMSIQKKTAAIIEALVSNNSITELKPEPVKYRFYDSVLLNVLATGKLPGDKLFSRLFLKNHPHLIFQFLDNDSSLLQDLQLITTLPIIPFLKAGVQEIL
jgi:lycopene beta-cyclase